MPLQALHRDPLIHLLVLQRKHDSQPRACGGGRSSHQALGESLGWVAGPWIEPGELPSVLLNKLGHGRRHRAEPSTSNSSGRPRNDSTKPGRSPSRWESPATPQRAFKTAERSLRDFVQVYPVKVGVPRPLVAEPQVEGRKVTGSQHHTGMAMEESPPRSKEHRNVPTTPIGGLLVLLPAVSPGHATGHLS